MKIFYDVDTQHDFMNRKGTLYVPGAEEIKDNLRKLTVQARYCFLPVIGSVDKHYGTEEYKRREGELKRWGGPFPDHCMRNTHGQKKIRETKPNYQYNIRHRLDNSFDEGELFWCEMTLNNPASARKGGVFFEKQSYDVFTNPAVEYFMKKADVKEAVVYGVATDYCVKAAVLGMQKRGIKCYVVKDAIAAVSPDTGEKSLEEMVKSGAKLITTKEVLENKMDWAEIKKADRIMKSIEKEWMKRKKR